MYDAEAVLSLLLKAVSGFGQLVDLIPSRS